MTELLPCPFCGGEAHVRVDAGKYCVVCNGGLACFCAVGEGYDRDAMPDHAFISEEIAVSAWNARADLASAAPVTPEAARAAFNAFNLWMSDDTDGGDLTVHAETIRALLQHAAAHGGI